MRIPRVLPLVAVCALIAGCGFFRRPDNQFYSLDTIAPAAPVAAVTGLPIGIEAIELPPGLDRRGVVLRERDHRLEVRGTHQWAAPLEEMVIHTLAFDLAARLPGGMMILPGQAKPDGPMRSIYVIIEELAPGPEPVFVLDARWIERQTPTGPEVTRHDRIAIDMPSLDSEEVAAAMSRALAALADRIVAQLQVGGV